MKYNLYNNSDKQLADRAWQAMRQTLDREMPEERRRRPVLFLWLLALLLPVAGLLTWWLQSPKTPAPKYDGPVAEIPIKKPDAGTMAPGKYLSPEGRTQESQTSIVQAKSTLPSTWNKPAPIEYAPGCGSGEIAPMPVEQNGIAESPHSELAPLADEPGTNPNLPIAAESSNDTPESVPAQYNATPLIAATAPTKEDSTAATNPPATGSPVEPLRIRNHAWSFGATAGAMADLAGEYAGMTTGFVAEWQAGKRWGFRTGLNYQFQRLQADNRPILSLTTASYAEATGDLKALDLGGTFVVNAADLLAPVYVAVSRKHLLEVPVLAYWQPGTKWRLYGGMGLATDVFVQSGDRSLKGNTVLTVKDGSASQNLNRQISSQVRNWEFGWKTGIGFRPVQRITLDLLLQNPLSLTTRNGSMADMLTGADTKNETAIMRLSADRPSVTKSRALIQISGTVLF